jgi:hypothetical protein
MRSNHPVNGPGAERLSTSSACHRQRYRPITKAYGSTVRVHPGVAVGDRRIARAAPPCGRYCRCLVPGHRHSSSLRAGPGRHRRPSRRAQCPAGYRRLPAVGVVWELREHAAARRAKGLPPIGSGQGKLRACCRTPGNAAVLRSADVRPAGRYGTAAQRLRPERLMPPCPSSSGTARH